jgi:hypothetical protein
MKVKARAAQWLGDHFSLQKISNLHEDMGVDELANGQDLEVFLNGPSEIVLLDQWVVVRGNKLSISDTKPEGL